MSTVTLHEDRVFVVVETAHGTCIDIQILGSRKEAERAVHRFFGKMRQLYGQDDKHENILDIAARNKCCVTVSEAPVKRARAREVASLCEPSR